MSNIKTSNKKVCLESDPEQMAKLREVFEKDIKNKSSQALRPITINNYLQKINKLSLLITGKCFQGDLSFLLDPNNVLKKLESSGLKSLKDYATPIVKLLKHYNHKNDIIEQYQKGMAKFKQDEDKLRSENIASDKQVDNAMPLDEIMQKIKDFQPKTAEDLFYKLIMQFYFSKTGLIPRNNLPFIKIASDKKKTNELNKEYNYLIVDKDMNPKKIVMQRFKNDTKYIAKMNGARPTFPVDNELAKILKEYLFANDKHTGDLLFTMNSTQEPYKPSNFLNVIGNASERIIGKRLTVDLIRSIWITSHFSSGLKSIRENEDLAKRMLNSTAVQQEYIKKNLFDGDSEED